MNAWDTTESVSRAHLRPLWIENEKANEPFIKETMLEISPNDYEIPALVFGAGYGYEEAVKKLKPHILKSDGLGVTTFSTDKALPAFTDDPPCYVLSVNTEETSAVRLKEWYKNVSEMSNLILPVTAHPSHVRIWMENNGGDIYWMVPQNIDDDLSSLWSEKYHTPALPRGSNSGEFAWLTASFLKCRPIGLIGMTYAWKTLKEVLDIQSVEKYDYHEFYDEGRHCYTTLGFMSQRTEFLELVDLYGKETETYNCSEGGILYSDNVKRMTVEDFLEKYVR